jgi:K+-transporting ATPase ATPase C chain
VLTVRNKIKKNYGPAFRLAVVSLLLCGLVFPLVVTGIAQLLLPSQANGSVMQFNGHNVGSDLIAQTFTKPFFFHPRNGSLSASGVDPDITLQDALSQIPLISSATGISPDALTQLVNQNVEGTLWIFGSPYVNVLRLNLLLLQNYRQQYQNLDPGIFA